MLLFVSAVINTERGEDIDHQAPCGIGYLRRTAEGSGVARTRWWWWQKEISRSEFGTAHSKVMCRFSHNPISHLWVCPLLYILRQHKAARNDLVR